MKALVRDFLHIFSYFIVGGLATLVEWGFFFLFNSILGIHYQPSTLLALIISTFANWLFGRLMTFRNAARQNVLKEIGKIYLVSIVGILLNMLLMWIFVEKMDVHEMLSKIIATGIVFFYNYFVRKLMIYRRN